MLSDGIPCTRSSNLTANNDTTRESQSFSLAVLFSLFITTKRSKKTTKTGKKEEGKRKKEANRTPDSCTPSPVWHSGRQLIQPRMNRTSPSSCNKLITAAHKSHFTPSRLSAVFSTALRIGLCERVAHGLPRFGRSFALPNTSPPDRDSYCPHGGFGSSRNGSGCLPSMAVFLQSCCRECRPMKALKVLQGSWLTMRALQTRRPGWEQTSRVCARAAEEC